MTNQKYSLSDEHQIGLKNVEVIREIKKSKELYKRFLRKFKSKLDLSNVKSINLAYQEAKEIRVFEQAEKIRNILFGKDIYFYGVSYLWDACMNHCKYCPGSVINRKKAIKEGKNYPVRCLSVDQAVKDTLAVLRDGHKHICYLTGSTPCRTMFPKKIIPYLDKIIEKTKEYGLKEIILNIEPLYFEGFKEIVEAVKKSNEKYITNVSLQFRVFQETYNRDTYNKMHNPLNLKRAPPKADYDFRINSQERAIKAGFDNVGLGVLFGLHKYPLEELDDLKNHAERLDKNFNKKPMRICLPSANELENIGVKIPYFLERGNYNGLKREKLIEPGNYEKFNELIYALTRLAMPTINIVSSERDGPAMLNILDKYATCTTLNVHPGVGDNAKLFKSKGHKETHFEQATTFPRNPKKTLKEMKQRGYNPVL